LIQPAASKILQSWGLGPDFDGISDVLLTTYFRDLKSGQILTKKVAVDVAETPIYGTSRQAAQKLLYECAVASGAQFQFAAAVDGVSDDNELATVTLAGGKTLSANLVLAADGISSRIRPRILSDLQVSLDPIISNITFFGIRIPVDELRVKPEAKPLIESADFNGWAGTDLLVSCRASYKLNTFAAHYGIVSDVKQNGKLWDEVGDGDAS
jgi:salicylate hydroxylase